MRLGLGLLLLCACGAPEPLVALDPPAHGVQLALAAELEPGGERVLCRYATVARAEPVVTSVHARYSRGGHHFSVYTTDLMAPPRADVFLCDVEDYQEHTTGILFGAQTRDAALELPAGVGLPLGGRVVVLQAHFMNLSGEPLPVEARVNLEMAAGVEREAGTVFMAHPAVYVPPLASAARAMLSCPLSQEVQLLAVGGHMHGRGTHFDSRYLAADGATAALYQTPRWDDPAPVLVPATPLAAGGRLELSCTFANIDGAPFYEGASAIDSEMCMFVGLTVPALPIAERFCWNGRVIGAGAASCGATFECLRACPDLHCAARCAAESCPAAAAPLEDLGSCARAACAGACPPRRPQDLRAWGTACAACIEANCAPAADGCRAAGCG